jgi:NADH-quinone oxidoreductase subunit L
VDDGLVDGAVNAVGRAVAGAGQLSRRWQTGFTRQYALSMLVGGLVLILYLVLKGL